MRNALTTMALGLALAACSGTTTKGGSTTAGTSSGTSTGAGTTTGAAPLAAGAACASNQACASGVCGPDGSGKCCTAKCSTDDQTCGASACDGTGACSYPNAGSACGTACTQGATTQSTCDGKGTCVAGLPVACSGNFTCNADAGVCNQSCVSIIDCAPSFVCNAHKCAPIATNGSSCTEDDDCVNGICGIAGTGFCCATGCNTGTGAPCGATGCDDAGACTYPDAGSACGSTPASCTGNTEMSASACDGLGNCGQPAGKACTPYICGPTACLTTCTDGSSCGAGDFCDVGNSACCGGLVANGTIKVDAATGSDSVACCGLGFNQACQSITKAMASIDAAQAAHVTILATVSGGSGDWMSSTETYPIVLGWGAELVAPGVFFSDPNGDNEEIFDIAPFSASDVATTASIDGTVIKPVGIGMSIAGLQLTDLSAIQVESGRTLFLANASLNGSSTNHTAAITVAAGGSLTLGQNESVTTTGTVYIGNGLNKAASDGWTGIACLADETNATGCTVTDATLKATSSVVFQGQENNDIDAEDYASIQLTSAPVIGLAPPITGFGTCGTAKPDGSGMGPTSAAVLLRGQATMTFSNGTVQCIGADGFELQPFKSNTPTLSLDKTTIRNTETAIDAAAGTATVSRSTIEFNYNGVVLSGTASIDLSGGKIGGNTVVCSSKNESVNVLTLNPGVCVLNQTGGTIDASNVDWDTSGPDVFTCGSLSSAGCSCATTCTDSPGADGMDAVNQDSGSITTTNNALSAITCG